MSFAGLNIGVYKEAAEHFLAALSMHPKEDKDDVNTWRNEGSTPIWYTLRRTLVAMDLHDLAEKANRGADLELFRQAGFEF